MRVIFVKFTASLYADVCALQLIQAKSSLQIMLVKQGQLSCSKLPKNDINSINKIQYANKSLSIIYQNPRHSLMLKVLLFVFILVTVSSKSFPIFNYSYQVPFDQTIIYNKVSYRTVGQWFYDPLKNRERVDRLSGEFNQFCGTILPNVTTPCSSLTVGNNRWQIFPARSQCCLCCTAQNGCGILKPDWLNGANYQGQVPIDGVNYDKWQKQGAATLDSLFVTVNQELPRRLDESGVQILDYNLKQFKKTEFSDSVFAVPGYCNVAKPILCPKTSLCGDLQSKSVSKNNLIDEK